MTVKTNFSDEDFMRILSEYSLGDYQNSQPITQGTVQTNYYLQTSHGKFVFRYYENRPIESVMFESDLIRYLKAQNYPCPALFPNQRGRFVGIYHAKPYAIFEFVEGETITRPNADQQKQLIHKVAELQNLTQNYRPRYRKYRWNYTPELCRELASKASQTIGTDNAREKLIWYNAAVDKLWLPNALPKGICHCDFHFSNILFRDGEFAALLDFDDANYTYLPYDLITLINPFIPAFNWDSWSQFTSEGNIFDFREARRIVAEYTHVRPLNWVEKRHLFDVFALSILIDCLWYFERGAANDFYEKRKIDHLNGLGRKKFYEELFLTSPD